MMKLNNEHIDFIVKDLHDKGILHEELKDEILDHVCAAVETKMQAGERFIEAYETVIKSFGDTSGLQRTQSDILKNPKPKLIMFRNYFTTALRQLAKGRLYTAINVAGLSIGIAACILIVLYIQNEVSFDAWNDKASRIYRVHTEIKFGPNHVKLANGPRR